MTFFPFSSIFSLLSQQSLNNLARQQSLTKQINSQSFDPYSSRVAARLRLEADQVSISLNRLTAPNVTTRVPEIPQQVFSDIAAQIDSIGTRVNNLDPGAVDINQSQSRFLFEQIGSSIELLQAVATPGFSVTNESDGSKGINNTQLDRQVGAFLDQVSGNDGALDLAIREIDDVDLRSSLEAIRDDIVALDVPRNAGNAGQALDLVQEALDLLPGTEPTVFSEFDLTTLDQTSENLAQFFFTQARALTDIAGQEFSQDNPNNDLLDELNQAFEELLGDNDVLDRILKGLPGGALRDSLQDAREDALALDINDSSEIAGVRPAIQDAFDALPGTEPLIDPSNPGGADPVGEETLADIRTEIEDVFAAVQNIIDNSGITDSGVLAALQDVSDELQEIDFGGSNQDALDVLDSARALLTIAEDTEPTPVETVVPGTGGSEVVDIGSGVREALLNAADRIEGSGQAAAIAELTALQLQQSVLDQIFQRTVDLSRSLVDILDRDRDDDRFSDFGFLIRL